MEEKLDLIEIIRKRRSFNIRTLSTKAIDEAILQNIMEAANWAPNHGLTEPWRFIRFSSEKRVELSLFMAQLYLTLNQNSDSFSQKKYQSLKSQFNNGAEILGIVMERHENSKIPENEDISAVAMSIQNMHLMATSYGIGAKWSTGELIYRNELHGFLNLTVSQRFLGFFFMGYPIEDWPIGKRLTTIQDKIIRRV